MRDARHEAYDLNDQVMRVGPAERSASLSSGNVSLCFLSVSTFFLGEGVPTFGKNALHLDAATFFFLFED